MVLVVEEVVVVLVVVLVVEEVVEVVVVLDVVLVVVLAVVELVVKRQTVGSGSSPINNSLWLSALPLNVSKIILPFIWLNVVLAVANGARTEP